MLLIEQKRLIFCQKMLILGVPASPFKDKIGNAVLDGL